MTYAITGASGQLGRLAADLLLQRVDPSEVVLLSRDPAKLTDFADRGATVRAVDFTDPATLAGAFAGVHRLLLVSTDAVGARVAHHRAAIDAAKAAGVQRVAYTSIPRPEAGNPAAVVPDHAATEQDLRDSGLEWVLLRNNLYSDMQLPTIQQAASSGQLVTNAGDGTAAYVTRADCAAAAVGALLDDAAANTAVDVTGPDAIGATDLADLASKVAGHAVEVVHVDDDAYIAGLVGAGLPQPVAELLASFGASIRLGYLADVTTVVRDLGGVEPTALASLL
jgi:NAD(P)H dehydrogenase (quinone)